MAHNSRKRFHALSIAAFMLSGVLSVPAAPKNEWSVGTIELKGNSDITSSRLLSLMETRPKRFWRKAVYSPSKLKYDKRTIEAFYQENGYLDAGVEIGVIDHDTIKHRVSVLITIHEGAITVIDAIAFTGLNKKRETALRRRLTIKPGAPLGAAAVRNNAATITSSLNARGFLFAQVNDRIALKPREKKATVLFTITEGPLCFAGPLRLQGLVRVRHKAVERELRFAKGDTLTSRTISRSIRDLYATGLFDFVQIEPSMPDTQRDTALAVPVLVTVDEAKFFTIDASIGYGTYDHYRAKVRTAYANLFGLGHVCALDGKADRFSQRAELSYSWPWLLTLPLRAEAAAYIERHNVTYEGLFNGLRLSLVPRQPEHFSYRLWTQYEHTVYLIARDTAVDSRNTQSVGVDLAYDTRRARRTRTVRPRRGALIRLTPEVAGLVGSGSNRYYRGMIDLCGFFDPGTNIKLSSAVSLGYAHTYGVDTIPVPPQARYYIGSEGMRPVRGIPTDTIGGTVALVVNMFELRLPIYKWFGLNLFSDGGITGEYFSSLAWNNALWVAGPGLSITIPLGELSVDFAYRLNGNRGWGIPFFSLGSSF